MSAEGDLEALATALEASADYRVLRRLAPRPMLAPAEGTVLRTGLFVDVETTGTDPGQDEIIELAMVPFTYGADDGVIYSVANAFSALRQPSVQIPPEITALTGISDQMVAGRSIDEAEVSAIASPASLVVAHNAGFDRAMLERQYSVFETKAWACSQLQVDWHAEGFEGTKLAYLAQAAGFFYDRHRAENDCLAGIELLARRLPRSGTPAMLQLLEKARLQTRRIWATNSPYESKDALKRRGYRWSDGAGGKPRAWWFDVEEAALEAELTFLRTEIFRREVNLSITSIDAYNRFSPRC